MQNGGGGVKKNPKQSANHEAEIERIWRKCEIVIEESSNRAVYYREQGAAFLRWSITTCLTINAGALVATINSTAFDPHSRLWSGIWFLLGALIAMFVTAILASAFLKIAREHSGIAAEIKVALRTQDLDKIESVDVSEVGKGEMLGGFGFSLSILSVVAFVIGACIMIEGAS